MKKHVLFITLLSALMLACSSNNGADQKAKHDTLQSDSIKDTLASDFEDLLTYFTSKDRDTLTIPDKYCYEFFGMDKNELYYSYEQSSQETDETWNAKGKVEVSPEKIIRSKNYVLLVYNVFKDFGYEGMLSSGIDTSNIKIFTPNGTLIQSLDRITVYPANEENPYSNLQCYYFNNDTTLYLMTFNKLDDDNTTSIEMIKYIILPDGRVNKPTHFEIKVDLPFDSWSLQCPSDNTETLLNVYSSGNEKLREDYYKKWIEMAENGK